MNDWTIYLKWTRSSAQCKLDRSRCNTVHCVDYWWTRTKETKWLMFINHKQEAPICQPSLRSDFNQKVRSFLPAMPHIYRLSQKNNAKFLMDCGADLFEYTRMTVQNAQVFQNKTTALAATQPCTWKGYAPHPVIIIFALDNILFAPRSRETMGSGTDAALSINLT